MLWSKEKSLKCAVYIYIGENEISKPNSVNWIFCLLKFIRTTPEKRGTLLPIIVLMYIKIMFLELERD